MTRELVNLASASRSRKDMRNKDMTNAQNIYIIFIYLKELVNLASASRSRNDMTNA